MTSRRRWWLVFGACAAAVTIGLAWLGLELIRLERSELDARTEAAHQGSIRLALWRADSWFSPRLAREAARQYFDYEPFYEPPRTYTKLLHEIGPGEVLAPSPLLTFRSEFIRLHFQLAPDGGLTSPQVPTGNHRDLAEGVYVSGARIQENAALLENLRQRVLGPQQLEVCVAMAETTVNRLVLENEAAPLPPPPPQWIASQQQQEAQQARTKIEASKRQQAYAQNTNPAPEPLVTADSASGVRVGPLVPVWTGGGAEPELLFVRRVRMADGEYLQGFLCDWPSLRGELRAQVADLLPGARILPLEAMPAPEELAATSLASIPAVLEVVSPVAVPAGLITPLRSTLILTLLAVLAGLVAVAITLRASILLAEKRSRFASAVTHELRTPLTTFRMYSEMLAEGWVTDEAQRATYLNTLRDESQRLATLVENVLAYARLEGPPRRVEARELSLLDLVAEVQPDLRRQAERAGKSLCVEIAEGAEARLRLDPEAVRQILVNLVENACKYAGGSEDPRIHLSARVEKGRLLVDVRDHGPGVSPGHARGIFAPFDRGGRDAGDATVGVGLGLAISRGLARALGGDLRLETGGAAGAGSGACFRLSLPAG